MPYLVAKYLRGSGNPEYSSPQDKNSVIVYENEIIIICDGSNSGETFIGFEGVLSSTMAKISHSSDIETRFLRLFLHSIFEVFNNSKTGAAIPHLDLNALREHPIPLPPLTEQKCIVAILDEAFAGIAVAKANAEKNLQNARELFDSYLESLSWEKKPLGEFVNIKTGKLDVNAANENGQYPFFTCAREVYAIDTYAFDCEAILLAGNNASGDFNVKHYKGKFNAYQRTYVITVVDENKILYRYLYFQMLKALKELKTKSVGANTRFLKLGMIQGLEIALPPIAEQQSIVAKLDALAAETKKLEAIYRQKLDDLDELKKSILQKAFTGELTEAAL